MTKVKKGTPDPPAPIEHSVGTGAIAAPAPPIIDGDEPAGTITATPPAPSAPVASSEPITRPNGGGSYIRDRATGHLTKQEA